MIAFDCKSKILSSKEYDRLKQDPEVRHPEKFMLQHSRRNGLYQGCFSKSHWGHKRVAHKWDLFCRVAPKQAKHFSELPNHVRSLLGISEKKHSNSKFKVSEGSRQVPEPLVEALENILMERIHMGEEVDSDFCTQVLLQLVQVWNDKVEDLTKDVKSNVGQDLLMKQDSQLGEEPSESQMLECQKEAAKGLDHMLSLLRTCHVSQNHTAIRTQDCI